MNLCQSKGIHTMNDDNLEFNGNCVNYSESSDEDSVDNFHIYTVNNCYESDQAFVKQFSGS